MAVLSGFRVWISAILGVCTPYFSGLSGEQAEYKRQKIVLRECREFSRRGFRPRYCEVLAWSALDSLSKKYMFVLCFLCLSLDLSDCFCWRLSLRSRYLPKHHMSNYLLRNMAALTDVSAVTAVRPVTAVCAIMHVRAVQHSANHCIASTSMIVHLPVLQRDNRLFKRLSRR
jgi:hypothetical protein